MNSSSAIRLTALDDTALLVCHRLRIEGHLELIGPTFAEGSGITECHFTEGSGIDLLNAELPGARVAVVRPTRDQLREIIESSVKATMAWWDDPDDTIRQYEENGWRYFEVMADKVVDELFVRFDIRERVAVSDSQETPTL